MWGSPISVRREPSVPPANNGLLCPASDSLQGATGVVHRPAITGQTIGHVAVLSFYLDIDFSRGEFFERFRRRLLQCGGKQIQFGGVKIADEHADADFTNSTFDLIGMQETTAVVKSSRGD